MKDSRHVTLRTRVGEEVSTPPAELGVTGAIECVVDPVTEELRPQVSNASLAEQARMRRVTEQAPRDQWICDQPT